MINFFEGLKIGLKGVTFFGGMIIPVIIVLVVMILGINWLFELGNGANRQ